ncbi:MAG: hypothetical protein QOI66_1984 [Myxococcales bacterium]|nr:hypothetical protein [Myxococcales bacterium]
MRRGLYFRSENAFMDDLAPETAGKLKTWRRELNRLTLEFQQPSIRSAGLRVRIQTPTGTAPRHHPVGAPDRWRRRR